MRKLITREEKDKKTKRNQLIAGGFLILLMIFSSLGYAFSSKGEESITNKVNYNEIEFTLDNSGYWNSVIQGKEFITKHNPEEIKDILFLTNLKISSYVDKPLYFVGDLGEGSSEISRNLAERFVLRIQQACLSEKDCISNFPIKNCSSDNIIIFKEISNNGTESIYQEENCVYIYAGYENQTRYADKLLFSLLNI
ncbi:MAG: hypothetical protein WCX73_05440 [Candidatus Pacearchaeota archaeon]|jgi:hypothetical protein